MNEKQLSDADKSNRQSYSQILMAFQSCLQQLEKPDSSLDELAQRLEEGYSLLESLRSKLTQTEARIEEVIRVRGG